MFITFDAKRNKAASFLLPVSHAALMMLCIEFCPNELGTRGVADLPRSTAKLRDAADDSISNTCD